MYRAVKQRRVEHFACRSKWLSAGSVLQEFRHDDFLEQIFGRANELHDAMARLTVIQRNHSNVTANNAQEYFKRAYFLPFIDSLARVAQLNECFTRQTAALPAN